MANEQGEMGDKRKTTQTNQLQGGCLNEDEILVKLRVVLEK